MKHFLSKSKRKISLVLVTAMLFSGFNVNSGIVARAADDPSVTSATKDGVTLMKKASLSEDAQQVDLEFSMRSDHEIAGGGSNGDYTDVVIIIDNSYGMWGRDALTFDSESGKSGLGLVREQAIELVKNLFDNKAEGENIRVGVVSTSLYSMDSNKAQATKSQGCIRSFKKDSGEYNNYYSWDEKTSTGIPFSSNKDEIIKSINESNFDLKNYPDIVTGKHLQGAFRQADKVLEWGRKDAGENNKSVCNEFVLLISNGLPTRSDTEESVAEDATTLNDGSSLNIMQYDLAHIKNNGTTDKVRDIFIETYEYGKLMGNAELVAGQKGGLGWFSSKTCKEQDPIDSLDLDYGIEAGKYAKGELINPLTNLASNWDQDNWKVYDLENKKEVNDVDHHTVMITGTEIDTDKKVFSKIEFKKDKSNYYTTAKQDKSWQYVGNDIKNANINASKVWIYGTADGKPVKTKASNLGSEDEVWFTEDLEYFYPSQVTLSGLCENYSYTYYQTILDKFVMNSVELTSFDRSQNKNVKYPWESGKRYHYYFEKDGERYYINTGSADPKTGAKNYSVYKIVNAGVPTISEVERIKSANPQTKIFTVLLSGDLSVPVDMNVIPAAGSKELIAQNAQNSDYVMRNISSKNTSDITYSFRAYGKDAAGNANPTLKEAIAGVAENIGKVKALSKEGTVLTDTLPAYLTPVLDENAPDFTSVKADDKEEYSWTIEGKTIVYDKLTNTLTYEVGALPKDKTQTIKIKTNLDYAKMLETLSLEKGSAVTADDFKSGRQVAMNSKCSLSFVDKDLEKKTITVDNPTVNVKSYLLTTTNRIDGTAQPSGTQYMFPGTEVVVSQLKDYTGNHGDGFKYQNDVTCTQTVGEVTTPLTLTDNNFKTVMPVSDMTITADYTTNKFVVAFYADREKSADAEGNLLYTETVSYGTLLANVAKREAVSSAATKYLVDLAAADQASGDLESGKSYSFNGWTDVKGKPYTIGESEEVKSNINLYLDYTDRIDWKTVTFEVDGVTIDTVKHGFNYSFVSADDTAETAKFNDYANTNIKSDGIAEVQLKGWKIKGTDEQRECLEGYQLKDDVTFEAVYEKVAATHTVTFMLDDHVIDTKTIGHGDACENIFKTGKHFTVEGDSTKVYIITSDEVTVKGADDATRDTAALEKVTEDLVVIGKYNTVDRWYSVTFKNEDGTDFVAAKNYEYGSKVERPSDPTKNDASYEYAFACWNHKSIDGDNVSYTPVTDEELNFVTKSMVLYPTFTQGSKKTYSFGFYYVDKDNNEQPVDGYSYTNVEAGTAVEAPATPYIINITSGDSVVIGSYVINSWEKTVGDYDNVLTDGKAVGTPKILYNVNFEYYTDGTDAGTPSSTAIQVEKGEKISAEAIPANIDYKTTTKVYDFVGWTQKGGSDDLVDAGNISVEGPMTFVANYKEEDRVYKLTLIPNLFGSAPDPIVLDPIEITQDTRTGSKFTLGSSFTDFPLSDYYQQTITDPSSGVERSYKFNSISQGASWNNYEPSTDMTKLTFTVAEGMVLNLNYIEDTYTVSYHDVLEADWDRTGTSPVVTFAATAFATKEGALGDSAVIDLTAEKYAGTGVVGLNSSDKFGHREYSNYSFAKWVWYDDLGVHDFDGKIPGHNLDVYPVISVAERTYTVQFMDYENGNINNGMTQIASAYPKYGQEITLENLTAYTTDPTTTVWLPPYWSYSDNGPQTALPNTTFIVKNDVVFTAVRNSTVRTYTYTFLTASTSAVTIGDLHYGDGERRPDTVYEMSDKTYDYNFKYWIDVTDIPEADRTGYTTDSAVGTEYPWADDVKVTCDKTFMAYYEPQYIDYTVIFRNENNTGFDNGTEVELTAHYGELISIVSPDAVALAETMAVSQAAIKSNKVNEYTYAGFTVYDEDADGSAPVSLVELSSMQVTDNVVLTAYYTGTVLPYNIVFHYENGSVYRIVPVSAGAISPAFAVATIPGPEKAADASFNYTFKEWVVSGSGLAVTGGVIDYIDEDMHLVPTYIGATKGGTGGGGGGSTTPSEPDRKPDDTKKPDDTTPDSKVKPTEEIDINNDGTPQGSIDLYEDDTPQGEAEMDIDMDAIPQGTAKTGTMPVMVFYFVAAMFAATAVFIKRRFTKAE